MNRKKGGKIINVEEFFNALARVLEHREKVEIKVTVERGTDNEEDSGD